MSDETKIFTKNDKNGDKCASGGQESGLKLIFERGVAILVRPWRFPGQPKKFVFFSTKVGTINSGTSLDSREQFKKTGKLEYIYYYFFLFFSFHSAIHTFFLHFSRRFASFFSGSPGPFTLFFVNHSTSRYIFAAGLTEESYST